MAKREGYRSAIRSDLLYGTKSWATKRTHVHKMSVIEMLRRMCGKTRRHRMMSEKLCSRLGIALIEEKMQEHHL